jgi:hypothetical protein
VDGRRTDDQSHILYEVCSLVWRFG